MLTILFGTALVVFLAMVAPFWIIVHYATRWRTARTLSSEDERLIEELWETLPKLEGRISTLESILDDAHPEWRKRT